MQAICNIVTKKFETDIVHYEIQFLSCTSNVDLHEIKNTMRKHTIKSSYNNLEPAAEKRKLQQICKNKIKYKLRRQHKIAAIPTLDVCIEEFRKKIREGPYYILLHLTLYSSTKSQSKVHVFVIDI